MKSNQYQPQISIYQPAYSARTSRILFVSIYEYYIKVLPPQLTVILVPNYDFEVLRALHREIIAHHIAKSLSYFPF